MIGIIDFNDWELAVTNAAPGQNKRDYAAAAKGPEEILFSEDALALCRINPQLVNTPDSYTHLTLPTICSV